MVDRRWTLGEHIKRCHGGVERHHVGSLLADTEASSSNTRFRGEYVARSARCAWGPWGAPEDLGMCVEKNPKPPKVSKTGGTYSKPPTQRTQKRPENAHKSARAHDKSNAIGLWPTQSRAGADPLAHLWPCGRGLGLRVVWGAGFRQSCVSPFAPIIVSKTV